jgi:hypothetical protein
VAASAVLAAPQQISDALRLCPHAPLFAQRAAPFEKKRTAYAEGSLEKILRGAQQSIPIRDLGTQSEIWAPNRRSGNSLKLHPSLRRGMGKATVLKWSCGVTRSLIGMVVFRDFRALAL